MTCLFDYQVQAIVRALGQVGESERESSDRPAFARPRFGAAAFTRFASKGCWLAEPQLAKRAKAGGESVSNPY
jgi:hypothetical protein